MNREEEIAECWSETGLGIKPNATVRKYLGDDIDWLVRVARAARWGTVRKFTVTPNAMAPRGAEQLTITFEGKAANKLHALLSETPQKETK